MRPSNPSVSRPTRLPLAIQPKNPFSKRHLLQSRGDARADAVLVELALFKLMGQCGVGHLNRSNGLAQIKVAVHEGSE